MIPGMIFYKLVTLRLGEKRQHHILDADYHKGAIDPYVQELAHLKGKKTSNG
jgi:hypothetical protein